jgi:hypothetical protein
VLLVVTELDFEDRYIEVFVDATDQATVDKLSTVAERLLTGLDRTLS